MEPGYASHIQSEQNGEQKVTEFFRWDPAILSVAVPEMDNEHIKLIEKMNILYQIQTSGGDRAAISRALDDFAGYTVTHFADEEAYMGRIKFEGIEIHKIIHKQLLEQVTGHVAEFQRTGRLTEAFFNFLAVWLTSHIRGIDAKYGKATHPGHG
jgi:hemerythrin-like metal-binding protein